MKLLRSYYLLCKPNVVYMMLICALVGMLLAEQTISSVSTILIALGIFIIAGLFIVFKIACTGSTKGTYDGKTRISLSSTSYGTM